MNSRQRVINTINHIEPDRLPVDLGSTGQTGINASTLYRLRKALGLKAKPIKIIEPFQMLGEVDEDVRRALDVDVIGLWGVSNLMGTPNDNWKIWQMFDKTPVLMSGDFAYDVNEKGEILAYPQGNRSAAPSLKMMAKGYFFDNIERGEPFDGSNLDARKDFESSFSVMNDETARYYEEQSKYLYESTDYAIVGNLGPGGFGDVAALPGPYEINPQGIRGVEDWLMAHVLYQDYILELFSLQCEVGLKNLEIYKQAVGDRIQILWTSGTDFGTQSSLFTSPDIFRKLYKPFHTKINGWIHENTAWKTFYHSCGSIIDILDDLIESGVDILNPVQTSATGMDPQTLKDKYGKKVVFWGGGIDTQNTLPFGTPEQVKEEVSKNLDIFSSGGGYVFNTIHNIVGNVSVENILSMFEAIDTNRFFSKRASK